MIGIRTTKQSGLLTPVKPVISSMVVPHVPFAGRFYMFQKTSLFPPYYSVKIWLPIPNVGRLLDLGAHNNDISHSPSLALEPKAQV